MYRTHQTIEGSWRAVCGSKQQKGKKKGMYGEQVTRKGHRET